MLGHSRTVGRIRRSFKRDFATCPAVSLKPSPVVTDVGRTSARLKPQSVLWGPEKQTIEVSALRVTDILTPATLAEQLARHCG